MFSRQRFRDSLLRWYEIHARSLPWRVSTDPYRIWVSEIMLQQTRVAAAIPYYQRFVARFRSVTRLASASLDDVLAHWSGLGYYSRARNMHRAAKEIVEKGGFPHTIEALRALPGVGEYTAAAVASIAFGLPHAVVDGNVRRVLSRVTCTDIGLPELAGVLLDRRNPGSHNQALMELGATVCLPRVPDCPKCPLAKLCAACRQGRQAEFPAKRKRAAPIRIAVTVLLIERGGKVLLRQETGFWQLPEANQIPEAQAGPVLGGFRHSIMNRRYLFTVLSATVRSLPPGFRWLSAQDLARLPVNTVARKALGLRIALVKRNDALLPGQVV